MKEAELEKSLKNLGQWKRRHLRQGNSRSKEEK